MSDDKKSDDLSPKDRKDLENLVAELKPPTLSHESGSLSQNIENIIAEFQAQLGHSHESGSPSHKSLENITTGLKEALPIAQLTKDSVGAQVLKASLTDELNGNTLHLNSPVSHYLILTLTNTSTQTLTIRGLRGSPTESNSNFHIHFTNNSFWFEDPPAVEKPTAWKAALDVHSDEDYADKIFILTTDDVTLKPGTDHQIRIRLGNTAANTGPSFVATVDTEIILAKNIFAGDTTIHGHSPDIPLLLLEDEGIPNPLTVALVGPGRILNDGESTEDFLLRLTNPSPEPVALVESSSNKKATTVIRIRLPISDTDTSIEALCKSSEADKIEMIPPSQWSVSSRKIDTDAMIFELTPKITKDYQGIPGNTPMDFHLKGVSSSLDAGLVNVYVGLERFPLYGSQTRVVQIEKSPLVFDGKNVGIGNATPDTRLSVQGKARFYNTYAPSEATWDHVEIWSDGTHGYIQSDGDNDGLIIKSKGGSKILLDSKVGVGTSAPEAQLAVNGGLHVGGDSDPGDKNLQVDGKVGIGTNEASTITMWSDASGGNIQSSSNVNIHTNLNVTGNLLSSGEKPIVMKDYLESSDNKLIKTGYSYPTWIATISSFYVKSRKTYENLKMDIKNFGIDANISADGVSDGEWLVECKFDTESSFLWIVTVLFIKSALIDYQQSGPSSGSIFGF